MADPLSRTISSTPGLAVLKTLEYFTQIFGRDCPLQVVQVYWYVATHNGCHKQAIEEDLDLSASSCSRILDWLGPRNTLSDQKSGGGLVEKFKDESNWRRVKCKLTMKGELLLDKMTRLLHPDS